MTIKRTTDGQAMVNTEHEWIAIADQAPPTGPKLLLINRRYGVAVLGNYTRDDFWTHWQALPKFSEDE